METAFLSAGIACLLAAIVGGGLSAFGIEIPLIKSRVRQVILGLVGIGFLVAVYLLKPAPPKTANGEIDLSYFQNPQVPRQGDKCEFRIVATNSLGEPIEGVYISIEGMKEFETKSGHTDKNGEFISIYDCPNTNGLTYVFPVIAQRAGYNNKRVDVNFPTGK